MLYIDEKKPNNMINYGTFVSHHIFLKFKKDKSDEIMTNKLSNKDILFDSIGGLFDIFGYLFFSYDRFRSLFSLLFR